ncbi:hypothetical protein A3K64_00700 [Candidatus Micrarchaeota archaeon RBG_16_36_9]|nr:MAG: hypothetical protein A3K64_00700 [Candidatus Micrarchaeota archaeon RBG_16_36_9]
MAEETTFLQNWIFTKFLFPFLLVFFLVFAILEKTKLFGDGKKQLNALIAFVIGLIFVGAVYPKLVVENMILFLTVAMVIVFVVLLLWGFVFGEIKEGFKPADWMKWILGIAIGVGVVVAVIYATGINTKIGTFFANQSQIWTNIAFVVVIAVALALILLTKEKKS